MPTRQEVFDVVDSEREFQEQLWPRSTNLSVTGEMTLLRDYVRAFDKHYQEEDDAPDSDVPEKCLHDLRKMAAILVRAMENHGAPHRISEKKCLTRTQRVMRFLGK